MSTLSFMIASRWNLSRTDDLSVECRSPGIGPSIALALFRRTRIYLLARPGRPSCSRWSGTSSRQFDLDGGGVPTMQSLAVAHAWMARFLADRTGSVARDRAWSPSSWSAEEPGAEVSPQAPTAAPAVQMISATTSTPRASRSSTRSTSRSRPRPPSIRGVYRSSDAQFDSSDSDGRHVHPGPVRLVLGPGRDARPGRPARPRPSAPTSSPSPCHRACRRIRRSLMSWSSPTPARPRRRPTQAALVPRLHHRGS